MDSFERLRAADPMQGVDPNMSQVREHVMANVSTSHIGRRRGMPSIAIAAALIVVAGAGGVFAGRASAPADLSSLPQVPATGKQGAATTEQADSSVRGGYWMGGGVVLTPGPEVSNTPGSAKAYRFIARNVDVQALLKKLTAYIGAEGTPRTEGTSITVGSQDGLEPTVYVTNDATTSFSVSDPTRSPWQCMKSEPASGSTSSQPECKQVNYTAPSQEDAIKQVRAAYTQIGLNLDNVEFTANGDNTNVFVQAWTAIEGKRIALNWYAEVSEKGVYSLSANAATLEELPEYPILGARDVALRTRDARWSGMGPTFVGSPDGNNGVVYPQDARAGSTAPAGQVKNGLPVIPLYVQSVQVNSAKAGLIQHWLSDQVVLLPSWEFTDGDGNSWAMIAVSDDYIDFKESR